MKFSTVLGLASMVTGITASATPAKRSIQDVLGVFSDISDGVDTLDSDIQSYSGSVDQLQSDSDSLIDTIKSGTSTITSNGKLSIGEASQLINPVTALRKNIEGTVDDVIAIKSDLVADGFGERVYQTLLAQQTAAEALAKATVAQVPTAVQSTAEGLANGISAALAKGVAAFKGTGGSSPSTTESEPSSTTTGGSSPPTTTGGSYTTSAPPPYTTTSETTPTGTGSYTVTSTPTGPPIPSNVAALKAVSGAVGGVAIFAAMLGL